MQRVLRERVSLLIPNVLDDPGLRSQDSILSAGIRAALCAPLWYTAMAGSDQDAVIGLVYLDTQARESFTEEDLRLVTAIANVAASKIENVRLIEESLEKRRLEEDIRLAGERTVGSSLRVVAVLRPAHAGELAVTVDGLPTDRVDTSTIRAARIVVTSRPRPTSQRWSPI